ncbi:MAG TPA: hypothetical protein G4O16_03220 [Dehalococcoidia bacterium]|nr:hypothetical protein [Dehalococcoidia bacterium]
MKELTSIRNYVTDIELNNLIKKRIAVSETLNNLILTKERPLQIKANYKNRSYGLTDILSLPMFSGIFEFEDYVREHFIEIRINIGKHIKELGEENGKSYIV